MLCLLVLPLLLTAQATLLDVSSNRYLALPAYQKAAKLWAYCREDTTPAPWFSLWDQLTGLMLEDMCPSFTTPGDGLPSNRAKVIHTVGTVGKVEWRDRGGHPYTGIFRGAEHGLARLSLALRPDTSALNTAPGMGLKFLRDGHDSANLVAMYSVSGQESWNFFKNDFSNHIPAVSLALLPVAAKFATATKNIRQVGLSDWARRGQDGVKESRPVFPYRLRFRITGELAFPDTYQQSSTADLVTIPSGTTLYQVLAMDKPEEQGGTERHIADLVLVSEMITSIWGDQHLYFRHQDMAEDIQLRPEWNKYTPQFAIFRKDPFRTSPCKK